MNKSINEIKNIIKINLNKTLNLFTKNKEINFCILCGNDKRITKEHIIPQWTFEKNIKLGFYNENSCLFSFHNAYLPCCQKCNSIILSKVEQYIRDILAKEEKNFSILEKENIIFWLKYIIFKLEILGFEKIESKDFKIKKESINNINFSTNKKINYSLIFENFLEEITKENINSLIIKKDIENKYFKFSYKKGESIFLTLPQCNLSIFYKFFETKK
ncbi:hypothetical protein [Fusobacterium perfoetens]|uniref:hypothetical protein n=1 Tax=Fusobacterium perfoetens TaxID=852 RepID=UPI000488B36A|nr:hypothetical protein [Fusobacterium perfoetens]MCI6152479.1 hypothetical protein [Fusobacterium perfoetens]MDY3238204.1 hypothetical protein [Fusobacterium perfoetens]